jgi:hypothetical protein
MEWWNLVNKTLPMTKKRSKRSPSSTRSPEGEDTDSSVEGHRERQLAIKNI